MRLAANPPDPSAICTVPAPPAEAPPIATPLTLYAPEMSTSPTLGAVPVGPPTVSAPARPASKVTSPAPSSIDISP